MRFPSLPLIAFAAAAAAVVSAPLRAQTDGTCIPVAQRTGRAFGCFITARQELGHLAGDEPLYWHLDSYPTRRAAEDAREERSTVVESLGRIWLFTIAPADWRPGSGDRVARIGPLPVAAADSFVAIYAEEAVRPGMKSVAHRHAGVAAWFTLEGTLCAETPEGKLVQEAGDPGVMIKGGVPVELASAGNGPRRSLVLVLQDATKPRSTLADDWTPRHLCDR
jgi:hypothetical protein